MQATFTFAIAPQPLTSALEAFVRLTGVQVLSDGPIDPRIMSPGISGVYSAQAALERMLRGADFSFSSIDPRAVTLLSRTRKPAAAPPAEPPAAAKGEAFVLPLPALRVEAAPPRPDANFLYGQQVRTRIMSAVRDDPETRPARYSLDLEVWLDAAGAVSKVRLVTLTGDRRLDGRIADVLAHVAVGAPPPPGMPQPVRVRLAVN